MGWFGLGRKRPAVAVDRRTALAAIPALLPDVRVENTPDGACRLHVQVHSDTGPFARWLPRRHARRIELDELGAAVVALIDGRRSVDRIAQEFRARFSLNTREAELSVTAFVASLHQRRLISMRPGQAATPKEGN